jgi:predicted DNA-binding protein with PD1-like motif
MMRTESIGSSKDDRRLVVVCDPGEEAVTALLRIASDEKIEAASFTAIGGFSEAALGFFDIERKDYWRIPITEQVEVLSLIGNVTMSDGKPRVHAHVVLGKADGTAHGGHLLEGRVRPTLELVLVRTPARLARELDPRFGIPLIRLGRKRAA